MRKKKFMYACKFHQKSDGGNESPFQKKREANTIRKELFNYKILDSGGRKRCLGDKTLKFQIQKSIL